MEPFSFPDLAANNGLNASMNLYKHGGMKGNVRDGSGIDQFGFKNIISLHPPYLGGFQEHDKR